MKNRKHDFMHHSENTGKKVDIFSPFVITHSFLNAILLIFKTFFYGRSFKSADIKMKIQLCPENSYVQHLVNHCFHKYIFQYCRNLFIV